METALSNEAGVRPPGAPRTYLLAFEPARDGFGFRNHFVWTDEDFAVLTSALKPWASGALGVLGTVGGALVGRRAAAGGGLVGLALAAGGGSDRAVRAIAQRWPSFGLCGGMALTAAERWPARGRTPTADLRRDLIRPLLRRRQEATLRASLGTFARLWAEARLHPGTEGPFARRLERELDTVERALAAGHPVVLGLVGDAPDPFALHQVVVYGIERRGPLSAVLTVYDPNAPGVVHTITTGAGRRRGTTAVATTMPTGPRSGGGAHVSTRPGHLAHVFALPVGPAFPGGRAKGADG